MPFFSIVTVTYNDDWALSKTLKSIFSQNNQDFELIVVDGNSDDSTECLAEFWVGNGLIDIYIREPDDGVYDAMNKGVKRAVGAYVLFMNAGDIFPTNQVLQLVQEEIKGNPCDALMGWGELNNQLWISWIVSEAFRMASLGFCHQSLYMKRELCIEFPFDVRRFKTDSDILQLSSVIRDNKLRLYPAVLAIRNGDVGISADLVRTKVSIVDSLSARYKGLSSGEMDAILEFRRNCKEPLKICNMLGQFTGEIQEHIAIMVLDTLFLRQSKILDTSLVSKLFELSVKALMESDTYGHEEVLDSLLNAQKYRENFARNLNEHKIFLRSAVADLRNECATKFGPLFMRPPCDAYVVSLTSFPKRISSVHLVIESLFRQSLPPARIILNLGSDEFPNENWLPSQLRDLKCKGLVINFVRNTAHQYDKILHGYKEYSDKPFVIVDDDVIYPPSSMSYLLEKHREFPDYVVTNRPHKMLWRETGELLPYSAWEKEVYEEIPSHNIFPTGAGGVLYPIGFFDENLVCNKNLLMKLAPYADDIWLKACSIAKGIPAVCSEMLANERWYYRYTPQMTEGALHNTNVDLGLNDIQLVSTFQYFDIRLDNPEDKFWN